MPDISMCANDKCPSRKKCYRFMAEPNGKHQSYAGFKHDETGKCDHFMDNKPTETTSNNQQQEP